VVSRRREASDESSTWAVAPGVSIQSLNVEAAAAANAPRVIVETRLPDSGADRGTDSPYGSLQAARSLRAWGPAGRETLNAACEKYAPGVAAAGFTVCLLPHALGLVSDVPTCAAFLRRWCGGPFALVLEPAALLTRDMGARAPDHLARIEQELLGAPGVVGLLLRQGADPDLASISFDLLVPITRHALDAGIPVIVPPENADRWAERVASA